VASWNRDTGVLDQLLCAAEEEQQYDHDDDFTPLEIDEREWDGSVSL
jgi:hypothetical protein